jgi:glucan phosphoethanolaminetransferase (alkaline phosphatase superfamily)
MIRNIGTFTRYFLLALLPNIIFCLVSLSYYINLSKNIPVENAIFTCIFNFFLGFCIFAFVQFSKKLYLTLCIITLSITVVVTYYKKIYSSHLTREVIDFIYHSDLRSLGEHFDYQIIIWLFVFAFLPTYLTTYLYKNNNFSEPIWIKLWLSALAITSCLVIVSGSRAVKISYFGTSLISTAPFNVFSLLVENTFKIVNKKNIEKSNAFIAEYNKKNKSSRFILVIGESARYDHFSINGYHRETSPNLKKIDNLVSFSNAYSLATFTSIAVPMILTNLKLDNHYSVIKLMEQNGFQTFWISNHRKHGDRVTDVAIEAQHYTFRDDIHQSKTPIKLDDKLLEELDKILTQNKQENLFIVLHAIGSHLNYDLRYPNEYRVFEPICKGKPSLFGRETCQDPIKLTNSYDNTILYSDYILSQIIKRLDNENAILLYVSDHGQSLGENGIYFHGTKYEEAPDEQKHVAMFIWGSRSFLSNSKNASLFERATKNKDKKITHEHIFHSIPHCLGYTKNINPGLSICK